jgi:hypothetical protein
MWADKEVKEKNGRKKSIVWEERLMVKKGFIALIMSRLFCLLLLLVVMINA